MASLNAGIPAQARSHTIVICKENNINCPRHKKYLTKIPISDKPPQALHGLAPKYKLINMHELINKSTNDYVTLLPCENGVNVNNKE